MTAATANEVVLDRMDEVGDKIIAFVQELGFDPKSVMSVELNSKGAVVTEMIDRCADLRRTTEIIAPVSNAWRRAEAAA